MEDKLKKIYDRLKEITYFLEKYDLNGDEDVFIKKEIDKLKENLNNLENEKKSSK